MIRGLRNNNPGNIRHDGVKWRGEVVPSQDKQFKQFETMPWGYRAMFHLINNYSRLHGCDTARKIISRWAPPQDNNHTEAYITAVCNDARVTSDGTITTTNRDVMVPIIAAMARVENGTPAVMADVNAGWELFIKYK
ncbi:structural protein P5 [Alistipes sp. D31t1_170403_E11]|uniref:structural protein P5 n=1 Tax=Alistipes sp. D31t1_170403_E11 TaxID=2787128 RepID=UPI0018982FB2|nr:structural protein P5 [Alistipes sp. D31t1_170403_E11]